MARGSELGARGLDGWHADQSWGPQTAWVARGSELGPRADGWHSCKTGQGRIGDLSWARGPKRRGPRRRDRDRRPQHSVLGPSPLCRGAALCVWRGALCRCSLALCVGALPALFVSGPSAPSVSARHSLALCVGTRPRRSRGALCVGARLLRRGRALFQRALCRGPRRSLVSGPSALCRGPALGVWPRCSFGLCCLCGARVSGPDALCRAPCREHRGPTQRAPGPDQAPIQRARNRRAHKEGHARHRERPGERRAPTQRAPGAPTQRAPRERRGRVLTQRARECRALTQRAQGTDTDTESERAPGPDTAFVSQSTAMILLIKFR